MQQLVSNGITNHFFFLRFFVFVFFIIYMMCHISAFSFVLFEMDSCTKYIDFFICMAKIFGIIGKLSIDSLGFWYVWLSCFIIRLKDAARDGLSMGYWLFQAEKLTFFLNEFMPFSKQNDLFARQYILLELKLHLCFLKWMSWFFTESNELLLWMKSHTQIRYFKPKYKQLFTTSHDLFPHNLFSNNFCEMNSHELHQVTNEKDQSR